MRSLGCVTLLLACLALARELPLDVVPFGNLSTQITLRGAPSSATLESYCSLPDVSTTTVKLKETAEFTSRYCLKNSSRTVFEQGYGRCHSEYACDLVALSQNGAYNLTLPAVTGNSPYTVALLLWPVVDATKSFLPDGTEAPTSVIRLNETMAESTRIKLRILGVNTTSEYRCPFRVYADHKITPCPIQCEDKQCAQDVSHDTSTDEWYATQGLFTGRIMLVAEAVRGVDCVIHAEWMSEDSKAIERGKFAYVVLLLIGACVFLPCFCMCTCICCCVSNCRGVGKAHCWDAADQLRLFNVYFFGFVVLLLSLVAVFMLLVQDVMSRLFGPNIVAQVSGIFFLIILGTGCVVLLMALVLFLRCCCADHHLVPEIDRPGFTARKFIQIPKIIFLKIMRPFYSVTIGWLLYLEVKALSEQYTYITEDLVQAWMVVKIFQTALEVCAALYAFTRVALICKEPIPMADEHRSIRYNRVMFLLDGALLVFAAAPEFALVVLLKEADGCPLGFDFKVEARSATISTDLAVWLSLAGSVAGMVVSAWGIQGFLRSMLRPSDLYIAESPEEATIARELLPAGFKVVIMNSKRKVAPMVYDEEV